MKPSPVRCAAALVLTASCFSVPATAASPAVGYVPSSLVQSKIRGGPWVLHQKGDDADDLSYDASGVVPTAANGTAPPYHGSGTPYVDYCTGSGRPQRNLGVSLMQPYYFPFVEVRDGVLQGFFDYRPRNEQEAVVSARSNDWGKSWSFAAEALRLNPYCPADITDPDNQNVIVGGVVTPYASNAANAADNGLGHAFILDVAGVTRLYQLNRANNHIDVDQLVVHVLHGSDAVDAIAGLPARGYVDSLAAKGYPALEASAQATSGLVNADAILGAVKTPAATLVV